MVIRLGRPPGGARAGGAEVEVEPGVLRGVDPRVVADDERLDELVGLPGGDARLGADRGPRLPRPLGFDDESGAALRAALLGIGVRMVRELGRGNFEIVMIKGDAGYLVLTRCAPDAVLAVLAAKSAKLGLIFLDISRTAKEVGKLLA